MWTDTRSTIYIPTGIRPLSSTTEVITGDEIMTAALTTIIVNQSGTPREYLLRPGTQDRVKNLKLIGSTDVTIRIQPNNIIAKLTPDDPCMSLVYVNSQWVSSGEGLLLTERAFLQSEPQQSFARAGQSIAITPDGTTMVVGIHDQTGPSASKEGGLAIYIRIVSEWVQQGPLLFATTGQADADLGWSVAISSDGDTIAAGAYNWDTANGAIIVFVRSGGEWSQQDAPIQLAIPQANARLGQSIEISADGNTIAAGASGWDGAAGSDEGAVFVFTRSNGIWSPEGVGPTYELVPAEAQAGATFGNSVALSYDGNTLTAGALNYDIATVELGAIFVFTRTAGIWTQQGSLLLPSVLQANQKFSDSVTLAADGNTMAVGAPGYDTEEQNNQGAAYVFTRTAGVWSQEAGPLTSTITQNFGLANNKRLRLSGNGCNLAISTTDYDHDGQLDAGGALIFARSVGVWTQQGDIIIPSNFQANDDFGRSVALTYDGKMMAVGANGYRGSVGNAQGAAYVFQQ